MSADVVPLHPTPEPDPERVALVMAIDDLEALTAPTIGGRPLTWHQRRLLDACTPTDFREVARRLRSTAVAQELRIAAWAVVDDVLAPIMEQTGCTLTEAAQRAPEGQRLEVLGALRVLFDGHGNLREGP